MRVNKVMEDGQLSGRLRRRLAWTENPATKRIESIPVRANQSGHERKHISGQPAWEETCFRAFTRRDTLFRDITINTRGYAGGLDGRRSQRRIVNIKRVRSNAKS